MMPWIQSVAAVIFTFGLVIFLHELGHFLMCLRLGVRVERFAFGFGPELIGITHNGTRLSLCAFPLGGFVKPAGDNLEDFTGEANEYFAKPWHQRLLIVAAGPFMNYCLAFVLFFLVVFVKGMPTPSQEPVIGDIAAGSPAQQAGLEPDDRILQINGAPIDSWPQMAEFIHASPGKKLDITFLHKDKPVRTSITPRRDQATGQGRIGIALKIEYKPVGLLAAGKEAFLQCWLWTRYTVTTLAEKIHKRERPDLAGPVGIVQMVSRAARSGLEDLIFLIALISVAVGFFNLLPIPLLDGGHAMLYLWEGLSRRKLTTRAMTVANSVGLAVLLSLFLFATYSDILRIHDSRAEQKVPAVEADKP